MNAIVSEQLPLLAAAPNGISKLRELILELAVRGKLVAQEASDEPASELLKRIAAAKKRLLEQGKIKQPKAPPVVALKEESFSLPKGWEWSSLAEATLVNPRNVADDALAVSFVPMALIGTRFDGIHGQESRLWGEIKQGFTHFAEGDVGVAKITPCFENSKACIFSGLTNGLGAGTTELHIIRTLPRTIDATYVLAYVKSPQFLRVGETRMTGTAGQKRLPKSFVETNPLPVPPWAEQRRIVAKVDELMTLCDRLEAQQADAESAHAQLVATLLDSLIWASDSDDFAASWQRLSAHFHTLFTTESSIDALKKTLLQLAVMGKLVPQNSNDEPAIQILNRIRVEKAELVARDELKAQKESPAISDHEIPYELPAGWVWSRTDQVSLVIVDCPHSTPKFVDSGHLCLDTNSFKQGRLIEHRLRYVDNATFEARNARLTPKSGDIVFAREGVVGESLVVPDGVACCLGQRVMLFRPPRINSHYLRLSISEPSALARMLTLRKGIGAKHVNVSDMRAALVPLPPLAEQHRIVAKLDQLMDLCDKLSAEIQQCNQHNRHLADALVEKALSSAPEASTNVVDLSCYLVSRLATKPTFGRTAHMKLIYLADTHLGLKLRSNYMREAAGPLDMSLYRLEEQAEGNGWYTHTSAPLKSGKEKVTYYVTNALAAKARKFAEELGGKRRELDRLISVLGDRNTEELEIVATLFAAWNDALLDGQSPGDDWIIREVRENWHIEKQRFSPDQLRYWLNWMRDKRLVPSGTGRHTQHQARLL